MRFRPANIRVINHRVRCSRCHWLCCPPELRAHQRECVPATPPVFGRRCWNGACRQGFAGRLEYGPVSARAVAPISERNKRQPIVLPRLRWSLRRIERTSGVRRETAGEYLRGARDRDSWANGGGRIQNRPVRCPPTGHRGTFFADQLQVQLPGIRADEGDLGNHLRPHGGKEALEGLGGPRLAHPEQPGDPDIHLIDHCQVLVAFDVPDVIHSDGVDLPTLRCSRPQVTTLGL